MRSNSSAAVQREVAARAMAKAARAMANQMRAQGGQKGGTHPAREPSAPRSGSVPPCTASRTSRSVPRSPQPARATIPPACTPCARSVQFPSVDAMLALRKERARTAILKTKSYSAAYRPQPKIADSQLREWESARAIFCRFPEALQVPSAAPGAAPGAPGRPLRRAPARMCPCLPACGGASGSRGGNPPCRRLARARVHAGGGRVL